MGMEYFDYSFFKYNKLLTEKWKSKLELDLEFEMDLEVSGPRFSRIFVNVLMNRQQFDWKRVSVEF